MILSVPGKEKKNCENNSVRNNLSKICFVHTVFVSSKGVQSSEVTQIRNNLMKKGLQQVQDKLFSWVSANFSSVILKRACPQTQLPNSLIRITKN